MLYKLIKKCKSKISSSYIYIKRRNFINNQQVRKYSKYYLLSTYFLLPIIFIYLNKISLCEREIIDFNKN